MELLRLFTIELPLFERGPAGEARQANCFTTESSQCKVMLQSCAGGYSQYVCNLRIGLHLYIHIIYIYIENYQTSRRTCSLGCFFRLRSGSAAALTDAHSWSSAATPLQRQQGTPTRALHLRTKNQTIFSCFVRPPTSETSPKHIVFLVPRNKSL